MKEEPGEVASRYAMPGGALRAPHSIQLQIQLLETGMHDLAAGGTIEITAAATERDWKRATRETQIRCNRCNRWFRGLNARDKNNICEICEICGFVGAMGAAKPVPTQSA